MRQTFWLLLSLSPLALLLPQRAWALRCGTQTVQQGEAADDVRDQCGAPFFVDRFARLAGVGVDTPVEPGTPVTGEAWYYNFGPQQLMVHLDFSGGVLLREQTLGYGFVGAGGPCDFTDATIGMSVADLIAHCGFPATRGRNPLATAAAMGAQAPAWGETWFYPADGLRAARKIQLQDGYVMDVQIVQ